MDQELLRQREAFKKRAISQPTVEKRKSKSSNDSEKSSKKQKLSSNKPKEPKSNGSSFDYKTATGSSQYKFGILAKIINFMKKRHQDNDSYPLTMDEILDETNQLDIGNKNKHWLITEALPNNQKTNVSNKLTYSDGFFCVITFCFLHIIYLFSVLILCHREIPVLLFPNKRQIFFSGFIA